MTSESAPPQRAQIGAPVAATARPAGRSGLLSWLLLLAIGAGVLALAAAHVPPIFKKLGLFAAAYGLLVGLIAVWLDQLTGRSAANRRLRVAAVVVLALLGQAGIAAESFRITRAAQRQREQADPKQALARRLAESAADPADAKSRETLDEFRREYAGTGQTFADYLRFRVSGIGIQSQALAELFWGVELAIGGLAAGWIYWRRAGRPISGGPPRTMDTAVRPGKLEE